VWWEPAVDGTRVVHAKDTLTRTYATVAVSERELLDARYADEVRAMIEQELMSRLQGQDTPTTLVNMDLTILLPTTSRILRGYPMCTELPKTLEVILPRKPVLSDPRLNWDHHVNPTRTPGDRYTAEKMCGTVYRLMATTLRDSTDPYTSRIMITR